jgi:PAB1-binding protein PBP1
MTDELQKGETPANAQAAEAKDVKPNLPETPAEVEDEFDKERAMNTILKLREVESKYKKMTRDMERIQEEERKRKEAEMTDVEKFKQRAAELEAELNKQRTETMRMKIASKYQLPDAIAARLQGDTEEEMDADAKSLAELLPKQKKTPDLPANDIGDGKKGETDAQKRARIYSKGDDLFNPETIREKGGGVFFNQK